MATFFMPGLSCRSATATVSRGGGTCARPARARVRGVVEEIPDRLRRLVGVARDEQLRPGLEPALDAVVGIRDDRRAARGQLEWTARRRGVDARVRAPGDAEVDACL